MFASVGDPSLGWVNRLLKAMSIAYDGDIVMIDKSCGLVHQKGQTQSCSGGWSGMGHSTGDRRRHCVGRSRGG